MKFFSGFCFEDESTLFDSYVEKNEFVVAGFSYGAIQALKYTLKSKERIDTLILLSPAFFNDKDAKFKKMQLLFFAKDSQNYMQHFVQNVCHPSKQDITAYINKGTKEQLQELLYYDWSDLERIDPTIKIEIHLGAKDKIIDAQTAHNFFKNYGQSYLYRDFGHLLSS